MSIKMRCDACGAKINAPDSMSGKSANCPQCKASVSVPVIRPPADQLAEPRIRETGKSNSRKLPIYAWVSIAAVLLVGCGIAGAFIFAPSGNETSRQEAAVAAIGESLRSSLDAQNTDEKKRRILAKIADLEAVIERVAASREGLKEFQVRKSRVYFEQSISGKVPVIEMVVKNGTKHPVSSISFAATVQSPGRSVPWLKDTFDYSISGGLEPGEEATWTLAPNRFSEWGNLPRDETDMILEIEPLRIDGADGKAIFDARAGDSAFSSVSPEERLKALQESLEKL